MISLVSFAAGSKRHFLRASIAELTRSGLPPINFVLVTRPSGETVASILTLPVTFICLCQSGLFYFTEPRAVCSPTDQTLPRRAAKFDDSRDGALVFLSRVRTTGGFGVGSAFDCTTPSSSLAIHLKLESCLAQS